MFYSWAKQLDLHIAGQKTLERQRYQFPSDWLSVDQLQLDWAALMDILTRKDNVIKEQICTSANSMKGTADIA